MKLMEFITLIRLISLCFLLFLSGCSKYVEYLEKSSQSNLELKNEVPSPAFCSDPHQYNLVHNSRFTNLEFPKGILKGKEFNIFEKGILLTLFQFHTRPDSTDWSSRIQIHAKQGERTFSEDFGPFNQFPLLASLETIQNEGFLKRKISNLINYSNKVFPSKITIQKEFNTYLKEVLRETKSLKRFYKLGKPLQVGETYQRVNLKIPNVKYKKNRNISQLFSVDESVPEFLCSFDTGLYKKGIFLISNERVSENLYGIIDENGDYFFAITKKVPSQISSYSEQLIPSKTSRSLSPFCTYIDKEKRFTIVGLNSRDPGQLLFHLFNYGVYEVRNPSEMINYLNYPRHQFLTQPSRLLYESKKGTTKQLRYFLSLDFPIYHTENLGAVHAIWERKESLFISDSRTSVNQSCIQK